jgi:hypothetical protein
MENQTREPLENEVGYFTKDLIPTLKALVAKRWKEGNPICIGDPMEYMIPYFVHIWEPIIREELECLKKEQL